MILCLGCNAPFKPQSAMSDYCRMCVNLPDAREWLKERNRIRCSNYYHETVKPDPILYEHRLNQARENYKTRRKLKKEAS